jgi:hypothetical protein
MLTIEADAAVRGEEMKIYRGSDEDNAPVEMECEVFGFPYRTTTGEKMYVNTHFLTESEAWESIKASARASIKLADDYLIEIKDEMERAKQIAARAVERSTIVKNGFEEWKRKNEN